jgi:2-C-methyl-D-erythritol 2,4-cyclodiphosphate synthase
VRGEGAFILNVDSSVVLEAPKLRPYVDDMRSIIAEALELDMKRVSIKATTNERMGFVGRQEGVAAMAIAQLEYVV